MPTLSDPEAMRYWSSTSAPDPREKRNLAALDGRCRPGDQRRFHRGTDGRLIGKLGCWRLPEIGFMSIREAWGQGFAGEALRAYLDRRRSHRLTAGDQSRCRSAQRMLRCVCFSARASSKPAGRQRTWHVGGEWCGQRLSGTPAQMSSTSRP